MNYMLYRKEKIVKRHHLSCWESWNWKQVALCNEKEPLEEFINQQSNKSDWMIEERPAKCEALA